MALRRHFELLAQDEKFLEECGHPWETVADRSQWVLIHAFPTHAGYNHPRVTAAIRMVTGYPYAELDMVYFFPALARKDGKAIGATQSKQAIDGKIYQRWSRHRTAQNPWRAGVDGLDTHVFLIEDWLEREFERLMRDDTVKKKGILAEDWFSQELERLMRDGTAQKQSFCFSINLVDWGFSRKFER